jgi:hypothetical protein
MTTGPTPPVSTSPDPPPAAAVASATPVETVRPCCPRCGYDLRGECERWRDACPLRGRCVECGLDFAWADLHFRSRHPWLFEADWRHRPRRRLLATMLHAVRPRHFWNSLRLADPIRLLPAAATVAAAALLLFTAMTAWRLEPKLASALRWWQTHPVGLDQVLRLARSAMSEVVRTLLARVPGPLMLLVAMPIAFLMIPDTLRLARVRRRHVARIWLYSLLLPIIAALIWCTVQLLADVLSLDGLARRLDPWAWTASWNPPASRPLPSWIVLAVMFREDLPSIALGVLTALWLGRWWLVACRDYLRLPTPGRVVVTLLFVVCFATSIVQLWAHLGRAR